MREKNSYLSMKVTIKYAAAMQRTQRIDCIATQQNQIFSSQRHDHDQKIQQSPTL